MINSNSSASARVPVTKDQIRNLNQQSGALHPSGSINKPLAIEGVKSGGGTPLPPLDNQHHATEDGGMMITAVDDGQV
jgi:hypothetical protein